LHCGIQIIEMLTAVPATEAHSVSTMDQMWCLHAKHSLVEIELEIALARQRRYQRTQIEAAGNFQQPTLGKIE